MVSQKVPKFVKVKLIKEDFDSETNLSLSGSFDTPTGLARKFSVNFLWGPGNMKKIPIKPGLTVNLEP